MCDEVESYCVCGWFFDEYNLVLGFGKWWKDGVIWLFCRFDFGDLEVRWCEVMVEGGFYVYFLGFFRFFGMNRGRWGRGVVFFFGIRVFSLGGLFVWLL